MKNTLTTKPEAKVYGENGNVYNLLAICSRALKNAGQKDQAKEMQEKVFACGSYDEALSIMGQYCELT